MFNLLWRKTIIITISLCFSIFSFAQVKGTYNYLDFANKPYYFGITLAYNTSHYKVIQGRNFILNDSIYSVESPRGPGFNLGIIGNLKVGRYFDFRLSPTLSFSERKLTYKMVESPGQLVNKRIDAVFVETPFHVRFKSEPYQDFRVFIIGGVKYSFDVASNSRTRQSTTLLKIAPSDFSIEFSGV